MIRFTLFWLITVLWIAGAVPVLLLSLLMLQVPLWPEFGPDSTAEGITVWAVYAAFLYVTPVLLLLNKKAGQRPSKMMVAHVKD